MDITIYLENIIEQLRALNQSLVNPSISPEIIVAVVGALVAVFSLIFNSVMDRRQKRRSIKEEKYSDFLSALILSKSGVDHSAKATETVQEMNLIGSTKVVSAIYDFTEFLVDKSNQKNEQTNLLFQEITNAINFLAQKPGNDNNIDLVKKLVASFAVWEEKKESEKAILCHMIVETVESLKAAHVTKDENDQKKVIDLVGLIVERILIVKEKNIGETNCPAKIAVNDNEQQTKLYHDLIAAMRKDLYGRKSNKDLIEKLPFTIFR